MASNDTDSQLRYQKLRYCYSRTNAGEVIDKTFWGDGEETLYTCALQPLRCDFATFPDIKRTNYNDILVTRNGTPYVHLPIVNSIYSNVVQRVALKSSLNRRFVAYALQVSTQQLRGYGVSIESFNFDMWKDVTIPTPPRGKQTFIADFLDLKTTESDALVAKYEQVIKLLEEKRISLITQAVTKGLDPNVTMKDSGVDWIGKVPASWSVAPLRRFSAKVLTGGTPSTESFNSVGLPWFTPSAFQENLTLSNPEKRLSVNQAASEGLKIFPAGSVLLVSIGATLGKVAYSPSVSTSNQQINAVVPSSLIDGLYLTYALHASKQRVIAESVSSTLPILNQNRLKNIPIAVPCLSEQQRITAHIEEVCAKIDDLRMGIANAIDIINERRATLIADAVNGQLDINAYKLAVVTEVA